MPSRTSSSLAQVAVKAPARLLQAPRRLTAAARYHDSSPILVYQMGKVGSSAVYDALKELALPVPVEHVHMLSNLDAIERTVRAVYPNPSTTLREIERGRQLRDLVERRPDVRWNVVTIAREPVSRNISAFFHSLHEFVPDVRERSVSVDELGEIFLARFGHSAPLRWFQEQLKPVFGVDPFAVPFPHRYGFQIIEGERARVLVLRYEDLARTAGVALGAFLGVKVRKLPRVSCSDETGYAPLMERFCDEYVFPPDYVSRMIDSRYARHFYTEAERDAQFERFSS